MFIVEHIWGVQPKFFVKLDFKIAFDKKEGPMTELLRRVRIPHAEYCAQGGHAQFLNSGQKISNLPNKIITKQMGALLVAIDALSTRKSFFLKLDINGLVMCQNATPKYGRDRHI